MDLASSNDPENLEKHRFLVQSRAISDEEFNKLMSLAPSDRMEEVDYSFSGFLFFCLLFLMRAALFFYCFLAHVVGPSYYCYLFRSSPDCGLRLVKMTAKI